MWAEIIYPSSNFNRCTVEFWSAYDLGVYSHTLLWIHSSLGDRKDIVATHHDIIIKSEISALPIVLIFYLVVCLLLVASWLYFVSCFMLIPGKLFHYYHSVSDTCKLSCTIWPEVRILLFVRYTYHHRYVDLSKSIEHVKCLSGVFCRVCLRLIW